ncbi:MAG TPA: hypothetical protein PKN45_12180 [Candidatus Limiplasma sp.]|mgnify:CR=1 FL=1|nr:hypothetical protein [Candidatus Limiplasma sp.]
MDNKLTETAEVLEDVGKAAKAGLPKAEVAAIVTAVLVAVVGGILFWKKKTERKAKQDKAAGDCDPMSVPIDPIE